MEYLRAYNKWINSPIVDEETVKELLSLEGKDEEIKDRFYSDLKFGTAGLRGKLGAGTNRMNKYVVARATQALANTIKNHGEDAVKRGVVIAHDVRIMSKEFSEISAQVLAANGIKTYLFTDIRPTPELSFAVRTLKTISGIVVTASHNPKDYNGYKVYWEEGSQILDNIADEILSEIEKLDIEDPILVSMEEGLEKGLIVYLDNSIDEEFYEKTLSMAISDNINKEVNIVYTPLNGTGNIPVREVLSRRGFKNVYVVEEQEAPDGKFPTIEYPNPEDIKAFDYALKLAIEKDAYIAIATDPDCDRVAIMGKKQDGTYEAFNGNQTGVLLINYIVSMLHKKDALPKNAAIVKSIVTGNLGIEIAKSYGVSTFETLTGFKNICALPNLWDKGGEYKFIFGYEESIGYVYGDYLRDKDAVVSAMIIAEMAAYYSKKGIYLTDVLNNIYEKYGYYKESLISLVLEGIEGQNRIARMMKDLRENPLESVASISIVESIDFINGYESIGKSNVLKYILEDDSWFCVRPSGTEPKIKLYIYVSDPLEDGAISKLKGIEEEVLARLHSTK